MKIFVFWDITMCSPLEVNFSSETSVDFQRTTLLYIPKDRRTLHNHRCKHPKFYNVNNSLNGAAWEMFETYIVRYKEKNRCQDIAHASSYTTDLGYVTVETKSFVDEQRNPCNLSHWGWLRLALSKGPNRVGVSPPHLRTERDPIAETLCFIDFRIRDDEQSPKTQ
jgi:hypothetical protein